MTSAYVMPRARRGIMSWLGRRGRPGIGTSRGRLETLSDVLRYSRATRELMHDHFPNDAVLDRFVGCSRTAPPPAVAFHRPPSRYEAVRDGFKICFGIFEAEDEAAGTGPAQSQTLRPQVVLQHPVVARWTIVRDRPYGREVSDLHRQTVRPKTPVELLSPGVPEIIEAARERPSLWRFNVAQELIHRAHDRRMRIERAARKADVGWSIVTETFHKSSAAAEDADGEASPHGLTVRYKIRAHTEVFLRPAEGQTEPDKHLIEDQCNAALGADRAQLLEPFSVGRLVETRLTRTMCQRRVGRRRVVRMQRLHRIDQHAGDVAAGGAHAEGILGHIFQSVGLTGGDRITDARRHVAPPAMISATKPHQMRALGVIARESHCLHHRFGARHVEGHFVHSGNIPEPANVVGNYQVIDPERRTEIAGLIETLLHHILVSIVSEQVNAVGASEVVETVVVEIGQSHAFRGPHQRAYRQIRADKAAVLERYPVALCELKIGNDVGHFLRASDGFGKSGFVQGRQSHKTIAAARHDIGRSVIGTEKFALPG